MRRYELGRLDVARAGSMPFLMGNGLESYKCWRLLLFLASGIFAYILLIHLGIPTRRFDCQPLLGSTDALRQARPLSGVRRPLIPDKYWIGTS